MLASQLIKLCCLVTEPMCVNNSPKLYTRQFSCRIKSAICVSNRNSNALITIIIIIIIIFNLFALGSISRGLKTKIKSRTNVGTATFRPRWLCGWRYPKQRPHCSVELKWIVAERGRRSRGGYLCIVWCAFQVRTKSPSSLCWWPPSFLPRLEQTSTIRLKYQD